MVWKRAPGTVTAGNQWDETRTWSPGYATGSELANSAFGQSESSKVKGVMATTNEWVPISPRLLVERVRRAVPQLATAEVADVVRILDTLLRTFQTERIYVFGSRTRGTPSEHSDLDLLVVVKDAGEFPHHLAQQAYRVVGRHVLPLEIVFISLDEFDWRAAVVTSLPATVLREGKLLYDATTS